MDILIGVIIGILIIIIVALIIKIVVLKKSIADIANQMSFVLENDTNQMISVATCDKKVKKIAKRINKELKILRNEKLSVISKNHEIEQIMLNLAHDIRTPLTSIFGYLSLFDLAKLSEKEKNYLQIISSRVTELKELTDELFDYYITKNALQVDRLENVCINLLLEQSLIAFYPTFKEKCIEPSIDICEEKYYVNADIRQLNRLFNNLINNAIKYCESDFSVSMEKEGKITFANRTSKINNVSIAKIFDRFFTVNNSCKSTGLGLNIVKMILEQIGGELSAVYDNGILKIILNLNKGALPEENNNKNNKIK